LDHAPADPLGRFRAIGIAYLRWALRNPTFFEALSTRSLFDFDGAVALRRDDDEIRTATRSAVTEAVRGGQVRCDDAHLIQVAGRALVYGFARMKIDGHFP